MESVKKFNERPNRHRDALKETIELSLDLIEKYGFLAILFSGPIIEAVKQTVEEDKQKKGKIQ